MPGFSEILLGARRQVLEDMPLDMQERFFRMYLLALNRTLEKVAPDAVTEALARELMKDLTIQLSRYAIAAELDTKRKILEVIRMAVRAHKDAIAAATQSAGARISASFVGVSREAFENLFLRRDMGLTGSYRSLSAAQMRRAGRTIEDALEGMVLDGDSWQRATQRIIDGLTQGDPEIRAMAKSMARRSRGLGNWLETATDEANEEAIRQARKIAYDARRIARTEPAHAFHEADRKMSEKNLLVKGMQWNLSPRHPAPDICDVYAKHDFHGMGAGVYPPEYLPPLPHPHDLCFLTHVLREPGAWQRPKEAPTLPSSVTAADVARYMAGTANAVGKVAMKINGVSKKLEALNDS